MSGGGPLDNAFLDDITHAQACGSKLPPSRDAAPRVQRQSGLSQEDVNRILHPIAKSASVRNETCLECGVMMWYGAYTRVLMMPPGTQRTR